MGTLQICLFFVGSLILLWIGILAGVRVRRMRPQMVEEESKFITVLQGALLTLFGLLMGFTFSMAVNRYDTRKQLVITEANAIGTTWLRTATLPEPLRAEQQNLLREYVHTRVRYHGNDSGSKEQRDIRARTDELQRRLWALASTFAVDHREAITSLYLQTLNQTIDLSEQRISEDMNRIPVVAWFMLLFVGTMSAAVVGMSVSPRSRLLQAVLPVVLAATMALTMDLDSPQAGLIQVGQRSMDKVAQEITRLPQQAP